MEQTWIEGLLSSISRRSDLLLPLMVGHLLADFPLQPRSWVLGKSRRVFTRELWLHSAVVSGVSYLLLARFEQWWLIPAVFIGHASIDAAKGRFRMGVSSFLLDQAAHLVHIVVLVRVLSSTAPDIHSWLPLEIWSYSLAILFLWFFQGVFVGEATREWRSQLYSVDADALELSDAGLWIGRIERLLIFLFVLHGDYQVVGFLVAAKSVFRFSPKDGRNRRSESEYFLVGTLISFALAIVTALIWRGGL